MSTDEVALVTSPEDEEVQVTSASSLCHSFQQFFGEMRKILCYTFYKFDGVPYEEQMRCKYCPKPKHWHPKERGDKICKTFIIAYLLIS